MRCSTCDSARAPYCAPVGSTSHPECYAVKPNAAAAPNMPASHSSMRSISKLSCSPCHVARFVVLVVASRVWVCPVCKCILKLQLYNQLLQLYTV